MKTIKSFLKYWVGFFKNFYEVYFNRKEMSIFLMGFGSGLPYLLGTGTLSYWLSKEGVSLVAIGAIVGTTIPYSLKFLWAPFLDQFRIPWLTQLFGKKRAWLLVVQLLLALSIFALGQSHPGESLYYLSVMVVIMTFLSATQDIFVDAYRIDSLKDREQGAGAAVTQAGYRVGLLVSGYVALRLSDHFSWSFIYSLMALCVGIGTLGVLIAPRLKKEDSFLVSKVKKNQQKSVFRFRNTVLDPFFEFMKRESWILILLFIFFYKYGDAVFGAMAFPFYQKMGFSGEEIANASKIMGTLATILGVFIGGVIVLRQGFFKSLLVGGIFQALTNLIFVYTSIQGHNVFWLTFAICSDNIAGGIGTSAFVAYLSFLCNKNFTVTQYALFSSLASCARTLFSMGAGWLASALGWSLFFVTTTGLAFPGLVLLFLLKRKGEKVGFK